MKFFDTHAHLYDPAFDKDREEIIESFKENNISKIMVPPVDIRTTDLARELAQKHDSIYYGAGTHPSEVNKFKEEDLDYFRSLKNDPKLKLIGEIGLDYYHKPFDKDLQREVFIKHLDLAEELDLPVAIHSRDAIEDTYDVLKDYKGRLEVIMHCFSSDPNWAEKFLGLGFYISLAGPVTFKNAKTPKEVAAMVPVDRLLIETDCPYLSPHPYRGKRNDPRKLVYIGQAIADIKDMTLEELSEKIYENSLRIFKI